MATTRRRYLCLSSRSFPLLRVSYRARNPSYYWSLKFKATILRCETETLFGWSPWGWRLCRPFVQLLLLNSCAVLARKVLPCGSYALLCNNDPKVVSSGGHSPGKLTSRSLGDVLLNWGPRVRPAFCTFSHKCRFFRWSDVYVPRFPYLNDTCVRKDAEYGESWTLVRNKLHELLVTYYLVRAPWSDEKVVLLNCISKQYQ